MAPVGGCRDASDQMRSEQNNNRGGTSGGAQKRLRRIRVRSDGNATMAKDSTSGGNMASVLNGTEAVIMPGGMISLPTS